VTSCTEPTNLDDVVNDAGGGKDGDRWLRTGTEEAPVFRVHVLNPMVRQITVTDYLEHAKTESGFINFWFATDLTEVAQGEN
jgi:hypothetical protein